MKKIFTILATVFLSVTLWAQSPEAMSYQAVVRNTSDQLVVNQLIGMQISILQGSASGIAVYSETHSATTNTNGLVSIEIGEGASTDDFSTIDWADGPYFILTETDPLGGINYTISGTSQLMSVPYALYAKTAENVIGGINETDPVFVASASNAIASSDIDNWNYVFLAEKEDRMVIKTNVTNIVAKATEISANTHDIAVNRVLIMNNLSDKENKANKSTDGTLASNSDVLFPTEKAVKTYVDASTGGSITTADLDLKVDENADIVGATKTKITYDAKGLVILGADATTTDFAEGTNLYYTEARVSANTAVAANTTKATNVSTTLSAGTVTATSYGITTDGAADDLILPEASTTQAGLLSVAKWDEITANTAKAAASLPAGIAANDLVSFDGTNWVTKVATVNNAGGGQSQSNMQPYLAVYHVIALNGTYPSRSSSEPFIGEIMMVGFGFVPRDWASCDGQLLSIASFTSLYSLLGTTYGGDGRVTFGLPDLRGRTAIHVGSGPGLTPRSQGQRGGTETMSETQMPTHTHTILYNTH